MPCSKGSGPSFTPSLVKLTVYFHAEGKARSLSCVYTRSQAALRLKWARHLGNFRGHTTEAA
jgi:hypothetical protein